MKGIINEALSPQKLITGDRYLQFFDGKAANIYADKEDKIKYACKLLNIKNISDILVYSVADPAMYSQIRLYLSKVQSSANLATVVKKIFKQAVSMKFKEVDLSKQTKNAKGKAMLCPAFNCVVFQDMFAFKDRGSFTKFSEFLESKSVNTSTIETDAASDTADTAVTREERDDYGNLKKVIHIEKTDAGKYYAKVAQIPEISKQRFESPKDAESYARKVLDKNGYKSKEFAVDGSFTAEKKTNRSVSVDGSGNVTAFNFSVTNADGETETISEDPKNLAFIIGGKVYGYNKYKGMNAKQKKQAIIIKRSGLVGQTIIESLQDFADLETYLPDYIDVIENGEKYIINNKETNEKVSVNISGNDNEDCREIIYSLYKITGGKLDLKNFINELNECGNEKILEASDSSISEVSFMTVQDLLSDMIGNVPEKQLDDEMKKFKKFARILHVKDFGDVLVMVDEGERDPSELFPDGRYHVVNEETGEHEIYFDEQGIVAEYTNGLIYIYFASEDIMNKFIKASDEFLRSFEIEENPFVEESLEFGDVMSIEECLNILDKNSNNKFDLLNCYLSEHFTTDEKCKIAEMIKEGYSKDSLQKYLKEKIVDKDFVLTEDQDEEEISEDDMTIEQLLFAMVEDQGQEYGSVSIYDKMSLDKAVDWLTTRGYDYDIQQIEEDGWELFWEKKPDAAEYGESSEAINKSVARNILENIRRVQSMLNDILTESSATKAAADFDQDIQEALQKALDEAKKFDY